VYVYERMDSDDDFFIVGTDKDGNKIPAQNPFGWWDAMALAAFGRC